MTKSAELATYGPELSDAELDTVWGGCDLPYVKPPSVRIYNPETGTWERIYLNEC